MCWREVARGGDAVALKSACAAIRQPIIGPGVVVVSREGEVLMIALEADDVVRVGALEVNEIMNGLTALRPTIDVVAEEDEPHRLADGIVDAALDQRLKLSEAAVDVADAVGHDHAVSPRLES